MVRRGNAYREGRIDELALVLVSVSQDQLQKVSEHAGEARGHLDFAQRRDLPRAPTARPHSDAALRTVLDGLVAQGVVLAHHDGRETVLGVAPGQHLAVAYDRNTIAHFFLIAAIGELALLQAAVQAPAVRLPAFDGAAQLGDACTGLGGQYVLQKRLGYPESVSLHLFTSGLELARRRGSSRVHAIAVRRVEATLAVPPAPPQR